jgi:hypothetical protein
MGGIGGSAHGCKAFTFFRHSMNDYRFSSHFSEKFSERSNLFLPLLIQQKCWCHKATDTWANMESIFGNGNRGESSIS